jgi:HEXXH motif-containing protein
MQFAGVKPSSGDRLDRKRGFIEALDRVQQLRTPVQEVSLAPRVVFTEAQPDDHVGAVVASLVADEAGEIPTIEPIPHEDRPQTMRAVQEAVELLAEWHAPYAALVEALVASVVMAQGPRLEGASRSSQLGTIYVNPQPGWPTPKYAETLLHEAVHEAHYLDQMVSPWFDRPHWEFDREGLKAISPIRRILRPLPLVLEACCVSTVLVQFLWETGQVARARATCLSTMTSLASLRELAGTLAPRGQEVLRDLAEIVIETEAFGQVGS